MASGNRMSDYSKENLLHSSFGTCKILNLSFKRALEHFYYQ